jgi:OpgC protein
VAGLPCPDRLTPRHRQVVVTFYAALTMYWTPIKKAFGGFLIPLGQSSLYVFFMHVYFAVLIANFAVLRNGWIWLNTLAYTLVLTALWVVVNRRFLFRIIPR